MAHLTKTMDARERCCLSWEKCLPWPDCVYKAQSRDIFTIAADATSGERTRSKLRTNCIRTTNELIPSWKRIPSELLKHYVKYTQRPVKMIGNIRSSAILGKGTLSFICRNCHDLIIYGQWKRWLKTKVSDVIDTIWSLNSTQTMFVKYKGKLCSISKVASKISAWNILFPWLTSWDPAPSSWCKTHVSFQRWCWVMKPKF